jgi:predicted nucleic acid-binding protein
MRYLDRAVKPRVYVETTVPSFYHEVRTAPDIVARRDWTRLWWSGAAERYELVTSLAVIEEVSQGQQDRIEERLELLRGLPVLAVEPPILEIVETYLEHKVMPADPGGDALHLALASYHKCDFLVTWNCRHLANANKFGHIRRVNTLMGLFVPALVTPLEMLGDDDEEAP